MSILNQASRQQTLDLLEAVAVLDTRAGRDLLLRDLPPRLVGSIERSEAKTQDLDQIVYRCDLWWPDNGVTVEDYPLRVLLNSALALSDGSQTATQLAALLATLPARLDPTFHADCPYPGMVPFRAEDSRFFYGRETEIQDLIARLRRQRFLLVIGPSGSGKSSLVFAGLLPRLAASPYWPPGTWHVVTMRPGTHPADDLAEQIGNDTTHPAEAVTALLAAHAPATRLLLVIDQLEEVFTQADRNEQSRFISALTALRGLDNCAVLLTMRADFYPDLMISTMWPLGEGERLEVTPLRGDALRQAITEPADDVGVTVEPDLVERLLADAADEPGSLPLLQETLVLLWGRMQGRTLPLVAYEQMGREGRSGLAVAMASKADATLATLTPAQQALARRLFLRLIAFGEGRPDSRRQQPVGALQAADDEAALFTQTLGLLTDNRLLTVSGEAQRAAEKIVDISHEALIRGWPTLQGWISERRSAEQARRRLEDKAAEWVRLGRSGGGLLDEAELPEAERWLDSPDAADLGYSADLPTLTQASQAALTATAAAKAATQQREMEQGQKTAAAEARAQEIRRSLRRVGGLAVALAVAFIIAGVLAYHDSQLAAQLRVQSKMDQARKLAISAAAEIGNDPERSMLLVMEAFTTTQALGAPPLAEAEDALHLALLNAPLRATLSGHTAPVTFATYSPDGRYVLTTSEDQTARIWDLSTVSDTQVSSITLNGHTEKVNWGAYSPDGRWVATGSANGLVRVWYAGNGDLVRTLDSKQDNVSVRRVAYSPDGKMIAVGYGGSANKVILWDAEHGTQGLTFEDAFGTYSPDGRTIVTRQGNTATIRDVQTGAAIRTLTGHTAFVTSVAYSPDGQHLLTGAYDSTARVWNAATGAQEWVLRGHRGPVNYVAYSPDGKVIATASTDGSAMIWDAASGQLVQALHGHHSVVSSVMFQPTDARSLLTASQDGTAKIWTAEPLEELPTLRGHTDWVLNAVYSPDGRYVATASNDGTAKIWNAQTGAEVRTLKGHTSVVSGVDWSPDGRTIATSSYDHTAKLWNAQTGEEIRTLTGHTDWVNSVAFSHDGRYLVTSGDSGDLTAKIWEVATGIPIRTLSGHEDSLTSARFSPDDRWVVTASLDRTAKIWDVQTGTLLRTLPAHSGWLFTATFSPDGRNIITAGQDGAATIWNATTGAEGRALRGHTSWVTNAQYSRDGRYIVTASYQGTAKVWNAQTGEERWTLRGHTDGVQTAAFSPDGARIVTASNDGTARQYVTNLEDLIARARRYLTRELTVTERADYLGEPSPAAGALPAPATAPPK